MTSEPSPSAATDKRMTTADLIEHLQELDPSGERTVFIEIGWHDHERGDTLQTAKLAWIYPEDGAALWDKDRLRIVLTNHEDVR